MPFQLFNPPLAVVPIFVNAGAVLFPSIVAALISVASLILRPQEMFALVRRRPYIPAMIAAFLLVAYLMWDVITDAGLALMPAKPQVAATAGNQTNWSEVALELIKQEQAGKDQPSENKDKAVYERGGPERSGYGGGPSPLNLERLWEYRENYIPMLSSPLVVDHMVFGASCDYLGSRNVGSIFCLDAETGRRIWRTDTKNGRTRFAGFCSSPAITADRKSLVVGQGLHEDADSELICLDAKTGEVRWLVKTPLHIESSPAIEGDIAVAGVGSIEAGRDHKPQGDPNGIGNPGYILGVRISDGTELWKFPLNDPEGSPAIEKGIVYVGSGMNGSAVAAIRIAPDSELVAKRLNRLVWKTPAPYPAVGSATVTGDLVLIGCGNGDFGGSAANPKGAVLALDKFTGKIRWKIEVPDSVLGSIAVKDGKAVVPVFNGELLMVDVAKGTILWRQDIFGKKAIASGPAYTGPYIYTTSENGFMAVVEAETGKVLQKMHINANNRPGRLDLTFSSPYVAYGNVYVGTETGGLRAYKAGK